MQHEWKEIPLTVPDAPTTTDARPDRKNSFGAITSDEYIELEGLVERGQRLMVRKSEAAAILTQRGYKVTPKDMTVRELTYHGVQRDDSFMNEQMAVANIVKRVNIIRDRQCTLNILILVAVMIPKRSNKLLFLTPAFKHGWNILSG